MLLIGSTIRSRYVIDDLIHEGGQGTLAKARDRRTNQYVTLKALHSTGGKASKTEIARIKRAGSLRFRDPNVQDAVEVFREQGVWYLVLSFHEGHDLAEAVQATGGPLPMPAASRVIQGAAAGLAAVHGKGVIHRDIKPQNILLKPDGTPVIIDFGICRLFKGQQSFDNQFAGSLPFVAPEQLLTPGQEDQRTDIYALGTVIYFILTGGRLTFTAQSTDKIVEQICSRSPTPPSRYNHSLPGAVDQFCLSLLNKEPADRPQTATDVLRDWSRVDQGHSGHCPWCRSKLRSTCRYCPDCGGEVTAIAVESIRRCFACGVQLNGSQSCPGCQRSFGETVTELRFVSGTMAGAVFRIPEASFETGRTQLCPRDGYLSRTHTAVRVRRGVIEVRDAGSSNRTFVGGMFAKRWMRLDHRTQFRMAANTAVCLIHST